MSFVVPGVRFIVARGIGESTVVSPFVPSCICLGGFGSEGNSQTLSSATPSGPTNLRSPPIPNSPRRNFSRHRNRYFLVRGGSRPRDLSCGEERVKSSSHEENLEACSFSCRPMRVRKVLTSGTKGVG